MLNIIGLNMSNDHSKSSIQFLTKTYDMTLEYLEYAAWTSENKIKNDWHNIYPSIHQFSKPLVLLGQMGGWPFGSDIMMIK